MTMRERLARWKLWLGFGPKATLTGPCACPKRCDRHPNLYELYDWKRDGL